MPKVVDFRKTDLIITETSSESFIVCYNCNVFMYVILRRRKKYVKIGCDRKKSFKKFFGAHNRNIIQSFQCKITLFLFPVNCCEMPDFDFKQELQQIIEFVKNRF